MASFNDGKSKVTARLRFPEFRKAAGWRSEPMGTLYAFMRNNTLSRDKLNYESGTVKNIHYGDIHTKFPAVLDLMKERVPFINGTEQVPDADSEDYCVEGDLLFADASEDTNDVGKSMEVVRLNGEPLLSGQHTILARQKDAKLIVGFGGHLFRSGQIRSQIRRQAQGTKVYAISSTRLGEIDIAYPGDKAEQQKIADCLTSLDDCVAAQGRKVDALKAHKWGLMQQLFPSEGETLPRLRLPEFREAPPWEEKPAGNLFTNRKEDGHAGLPIYSVTMNDGMVPRASFGRDFYDIEDPAGNKKVCAGDLAYNMMRMWQGAQGVAVGDCIVSPAYVVLAPLEDTCSDFFGYLFKLTQSLELLTAYSRGLTKDRLRLYFDDFARMPLTVPERAEQRRIAACLATVDARIAVESKKFDALKTHKKGLMQQMFPTAGSSANLLPEDIIHQSTARPVIVSVAKPPESDEPAVAPSRKPYTIGFARQLLAAEILHHCHKHPTMGRVKLQKLIHLCEYHAELDDIHGNYTRAAAGPFDNKLMHGVANGLERQKWFKQVRGEKRVSYEPMESAGQHSKYLQRWSESLPKIREIIQRFSTARTLTCEIASTLYAAWNDLLIEGRHPTDEEIIREASDPKRWHASKAQIQKSKWPTALKWMRERRLVPRGYGAHTTKHNE